MNNNNFKPIDGAAGYRLSNVPVLSTVSLKSSLDIFEKTSMEYLAKKSTMLTGYLEFLIKYMIPKDRVTIISPIDANQRGCQLSLLFKIPGEMNLAFDFISAKGVICDKRKPDVIRVAPVPLYNTFEDVYNFVHFLNEFFASS